MLRLALRPRDVLRLALLARAPCWYRVDFEAAGGLVPFVLRYLDDGPVRAAIHSCAAPRLRWTPYHRALAHEAGE